MKTLTKLQEFAELLEKEQMESLYRRGLACEANISQCKVSVKVSKKYTKVDVGTSGKYMIVNATGEIFGIKAYGVIHRGHKFGTLETIHDWCWGEYLGLKKDDVKKYKPVFAELDNNVRDIKERIKQPDTGRKDVK